MENQNETVNSVSRRRAGTPGIDKDLERDAEHSTVGARLALPKRRAASSAPTGSVRRRSFPPYIRAAQQRQAGFYKSAGRVGKGLRVIERIHSYEISLAITKAAAAARPPISTVCSAPRAG